MMQPPFALRRALLGLGALATCALTALSVQAQSQTPLRVILPVSAGSGVDVIVRSAQPALSRALGGQTVVVENLPGAGGITGTQTLVRANPDGNTIAFVSNSHAINPLIYQQMPYDAQQDITPISIVGGSPFVLLVNPNKLPVDSAQALATELRARPGHYNYGSPGNGTNLHLASAMFIDAAQADVPHIPYRGTAPMVADLMGGQVDVAVAALGAVQGYLAGGNLRAVGIMGRERAASLPGLPTVAEQGFDEVDIVGWFAAVAPKGLPPEQVQRLHQAITEAFRDPEVQRGFQQRDDFLILNTPAQAAQFLQDEQARYGVLARKIDLTIN